MANLVKACDNPQERSKMSKSLDCRKSSSSFSRTILATFVLLATILFVTTIPSTIEAKQHDGKMAHKLDEYHSTIKCMLNIAEETLPELDDYMTCCGFWAMHDWIIHKVDNECDSDNLQQVKHLTGLLVPHVRDQCLGYEHGSFTCRLLVIMPITFAVIFILGMLSICVCAQVSCYKWMRVRRKYRKQMDIRTGNNQLTPTLLLSSDKIKNNSSPQSNDSPPPRWSRMFNNNNNKNSNRRNP